MTRQGSTQEQEAGLLPRQRENGLRLWLPAIAPLLLLSSPNAVGVTIYDTSFAQIDFFGNSAPLLEDSEWGRYTVNALGGASVNYLNVTARNEVSGDDVWIVQNLPIVTASMEPDPVQFHTSFDLSALGFQRGQDVSSLEVHQSLSDTPRTSMPLGPYSTAEVGAVNQDAEGRAAAGGPHSNPGKPIKDTVSFDLNNLIHLRYNRNFPNVEQDADQCAPGAAANSLEWLKNSQGLNVPRTLVDRLDELDVWMVTNSNDKYRDSNGNGQYDEGEPLTVDEDGDGVYDNWRGTQDKDFLLGKLEYAGWNRVPVDLKFQHVDLGGSDISEPNFGRKAKAKGKTPTWKFIFDELNNDEDVEIAITYLVPEYWDSNGNHRRDAGEPDFNDRNGNGKWDAGEEFTDSNGNRVWDEEIPDGGHFIAALGKMDLFGARALWFVEDTKQGVDKAEEFTDSNGNGLFDKGEVFIDSNGNGKWDGSGTEGVGFSWVYTRPDGYLELASYPSRNRIDFVVSESVVPEPATLALLSLGLVGIGFARKKKQTSITT